MFCMCFSSSEGSCLSVTECFALPALHQPECVKSSSTNFVRVDLWERQIFNSLLQSSRRLEFRALSSKVVQSTRIQLIGPIV
jgi:hypothetical protein